MVLKYIHLVLCYHLKHIHVTTQILICHAFSPCSNIGGATINDVALDFWHSGQNREDIGMEYLEHRLRAETVDSQGTQR